MFDSEKILVRRNDAADGPGLGNAQWPDVLPKVVQTRIVQSFENARYMRALGRAPDGTRSDFQLLIDIRAFQVSAGSEAIAEVELAARIVGAEGGIVKADVFRATTPVATLDAATSAKALSDAFVKVATDLVIWTCSAI